jgi:hypothetical protein
VAGSDPWAYDLPLRLFTSDPEQKVIGTVPLWRLNSSLERIERDFDLILARIDKHAASLFFPPSYLRIPELVDTGRSLPEDPASLLRASESLKRDIRVARQNGLETALSERLDDLEEFYDSMYVPFIIARHGALARPRNLVSLRNCFRRGGLIWLTHGSERLAGLVFEITRGVLSTRAYGARNGYDGLTKKGTASALYFHAIRHAIQCGCRFLDLGGCRACLTDGVLLYKRKWGVHVRIRPANPFYTLVRWAAWNPAVATFLNESPLLHQDGFRLRAITALDHEQMATQADADKIYRTLHIPGIDQFVIVNACGWATDIVRPPSTVLIGGSPLPTQLVGL